MTTFDSSILKKLTLPKPDSHKGQNGKVMIIAGSKLFHAASIWPLEIASRIVDMVYFASTTENNDLIKTAKNEFRNGIVVPRGKIHDYIEEADAILIGPGLPRPDGKESDDDDTRALTKSLLIRYPHKKWVIDGGSLQTMDPSWIPNRAILTPHMREFETLFKVPVPHDQVQNEEIQTLSRKYNCTILLKGHTDIVCSPETCVSVNGGNAGMTKGGTGDVLAGLAVSLYAVNDDPFLVAQAASFFNKKAGEKLFSEKGYWFNATDLLLEIPQIMNKYLLS